MYTDKKNSLVLINYIILLFLFFYSCTGGKGNNNAQKKKINAMQSDTELQVPDGHGGGYILTSLGRLIYGPWQAMNPDLGYNVEIFLDDKVISSKGQPYMEIEQQLVFELQKNGSLKYWFKKDYERHPTPEDSMYEQQGITRTTHFRPDVDHIEKIYTKGGWQTNFNDSALNIHFDDNSLPPLIGRYSELGSGHMSFQRTSFFDSVYNGQKVTLKKVLTTYYEHPWNNW